MFLPINQVKLTNVAVVRYNHGGKRFEIACYRNKVMDYRAGLETDLSEVLQTDRIFTNVSKGQFAASADLQAAFGTTDDEAIAKTILEKGSSLQVSDLERNQLFEQTIQQIAVWVASNCVHPDSGRPYTVSQIRHALGKNYAVQTHKAIKKQYLDAVKFLKTVIPIERAKMELSLQYPVGSEHVVATALDKLPHQTVSKSVTTDATTTTVLHVDPSLYRDMNDLSKQVSGRMEILQQVVTQQTDVDLEQEIQRRQKQAKQQQQQPQSPSGKTGGGNTSDASSDEAAPLVEKLAAVRLQAHATDGTDDGNANEKHHHSGSDSDSDDFPQATRRKNQRQAQKKSKKAKRRDKEEAAERQVRMEAEKLRQDERFETAAPASNNPVLAANAAAQEQSAASAAKSCNSCGGIFANAAEYRAHFRSDWHRFNQKLKLKGIAPVSEQEFLLCDADTFFGE